MFRNRGPEHKYEFSNVLSARAASKGPRGRNSHCGTKHTRGVFCGSQRSSLNLLLSRTWQSLFLIGAIRESYSSQPSPPVHYSTPRHQPSLFLSLFSLLTQRVRLPRRLTII